MDIDVKTLFLLFSAGNFIALLFFAAYTLLYGDRTPILLLFICAKTLATIQWMFFALRGTIHHDYSIVLANILLIFSLFFEIYCISYAKQTFDLKHFLRLNIIPVGISLFFFVFAGHPSHIRVLIGSAIVAIYFLGGGINILLGRHNTRIQKIIGLAYFLVALFFVFRSFWALSADTSIALLTDSHVQVISYILLFLVSSPMSIALLLILKEQDNLQLQYLNQSKDKFYSIIAHDLRGPLSNLLQLGDLIHDEQYKYDETSRNTLITSAFKNAKLTYNLLDSLLEWASANSGLMTYAPRQLSLESMAEECINFYTLKAEAKNITLINSLRPTSSVYADYDMTLTVLRNLLSNALKFTPKGGTIEFIAQEGPEHYLSIGVKDSGIGMSQEIIEQVFSLKILTSTTGVENEKGFGLGLKLCKDFVTRNKGGIWIDSKLGQGSTVWFSLPVARKNRP
ncbi:hypothetical protein BFP72_11525 [Reichenbachiella sp. 5M10]|uniref:sensor histidine kinase n=1 Tax=Reichenbachiella sp. 5M10 TaxID=1889772 RepID=UPI000C15126C|nr:HAMP domain-containing sensor histidine kinase [Reichenbachiella sp. 5M10]PIB35980.1 hypothetical protein BFP72_11525 [Reichenbachiella sp. 5M10]